MEKTDYYTTCQFLCVAWNIDYICVVNFGITHSYYAIMEVVGNEFKDLSRKLKLLTTLLMLINLVLIVGIFGFKMFLHNFRVSNQQKRDSVTKNESKLLGTKLKISRDKKKSVDTIVYVPNEESQEKAPLPVNFHGGGFVLGDASEMDTACDFWSNGWNIVVVSVNYTKPDLTSIGYGVTEGIDTIKYFIEHADEYNIDTNSIFVTEGSAGGYYAAQAAIEMDKENIPLKGQILVCQWTNGLPEKVSDILAQLSLFLGAADAISQKSVSYQ